MGVMAIIPRDAADGLGIGRARRETEERWDKDRFHVISCEL